MWTPTLPDSSGPIYARIVDAMDRDLAAGLLAPGARLPTHRALACQLGVTVRTVTRAYAEARRRGLVTGVVGRGTFLAGRGRTSGLEASAGLDLTLNTPPVAAHATLFRRALERLSESAELGDLLGYQPAGGTDRQREAGTVWTGVRRKGVGAGRVLICAGTQHALLVSLLATVRSGDLVATEILNYPGVRRVADQLGLRICGLPLDGEGAVPDALDALCRREKIGAVILTTSGHNPTTATMSERRRAEIAALCDRHDLTVIEDDVCGHVLEGAPEPLANLLPHRTYYLCGVSKSMAPGLRIGYLVGPSGTEQRLSAIIHASTWSASAVAAELASMWITDGTAERLLAWHRKESTARAQLLRDTLHSLSPRTQPGIYHAWVPLPAPWRSADFVQQLADRGVRVLPSETFAVDRQAIHHAIRLSLGAASSRAALRSALSHIDDVACRPETARAVV